MNIEGIIEDATKDLMKTKPISSITVGMILDYTNISRASFYRHYVDKYDLINKMFDHLMPSEIDQIGINISWSEMMFVIFDIFGKNRDFLRRAYESDEYSDLRKHSNEVFKSIINLLLSNKGVDIKNPLTLSAVSSLALYETHFISNWIKKGGTDTIENTVEIIKAAIPNSIYQYFD
jgi:AcrR family transcriptional regulator